VKVGYVLKVYPRYSETFVVTEILAHEAAGLALEIFALRPPRDTHFQDGIARVRAPVTYLPYFGVKAVDLWETLQRAGLLIPGFWGTLEAARGAEAIDVHQAALLAVAVTEHGIDHLHAHFGSSAASVARLAARFAGVSYSFTAHAKDIFHESVDPADLRKKLEDAAGVVTVSDFNLAFLRASYGPRTARLVRVYNGLDLDRFAYASPCDRPAEIVAVGRLVEKKGFSDLIDACRILVAEGRRFSCRIIGSGELEACLRSQIEESGLSRVVELSGPRPQNQLAGLVQRAAVLAAPCVVAADGNRDGLPTVLLEAMSLGTPCVSTAVTGIPEVVRHGETGLLVPQHDPAALAVALGRLLEDGALRVSLAGAARRLIETEFDARVNAAKVRALFDAAVAPGGALAASVAS